MTVNQFEAELTSPQNHVFALVPWRCFFRRDAVFALVAILSGLNLSGRTTTKESSSEQPTHRPF